MKIIIKVRRDEILGEELLPIYRLLKENKTRWQSFGAGFAFGGGIAAPTSGAALNLLYSFTRFGLQHPALSKICTILYALTVPLMLMGGHFLDLLEKKNADRLRAGSDFVDPSIENLELRAKTDDC